MRTFSALKNDMDPKLKHMPLREGEREVSQEFLCGQTCI